MTIRMELRWMRFVDGENLAIRTKRVAANNNLLRLPENERYREDVFYWFPQLRADGPLRAEEGWFQASAIRAHYNTSSRGDADALREVKNQLRQLGFDPYVFKKDRPEEKAKGVDIALTRDVLSHGFRNNYEAAVLVAGDGDYVPLVEEVKRLGKRIHVHFYEGVTNGDLRLAADLFVDLTPYLVDPSRT